MVRATFIDKNGVRKGAWSSVEDNRLRAYIEKNGPRRWSEVPRGAGLTRCGKSCRLRWLNYLRPDVKRGNYTKEENELICKLHEKFGNKWSAIAAKLPGRTDNEIKNHWHSHLKKQEKQKPSFQAKTKPSSPVTWNNNKSSETEAFSAYSSFDFGILESSSLSQETSSSDDKSVFGKNWEVEDHNSYGDFWTEAFISDNNICVGHDFMNSSLPFTADFGIISPLDMTIYDDCIDLFCRLP